MKSDVAAADGAHAADSEAREIACSMTSALLRLMRSEGGEAAVVQLLERAGAQHEASYLENVDNWISLAEVTALLEAAVEQTGDPLFARRVGESTQKLNAGTQVSTLLRSLGSPEAVFQVIAQSASRLSAVTEMEAIEVAPGRAVLTARARPGFTRGPLHCDWTTGLLAGTPVLFGLPHAQVQESECQAQGDESCRYVISWDAGLAAAAADPQQRVTALEAQLAAMSERLQGAFATAGDLVGTDDLDAVLRRIVERAADAVRAPSHVLAVRTEPTAEMQVYCRGIDEAEAQAVAAAALAHEARAGESTLVVEVASARRHYGQLIARFPGAVEFFPQDHELLSLYAKYAAAVLDMSVTLRQSTRRHDQVSSLLSLAHAVAEAGTCEEVANRLVDVVPEVVDCDRVGVWLWDELEQNLSYLATSGRTPEQHQYLRQLVVSANDTPHLRKMVAAPDPQFFTADTEDPFVHDLMGALGVIGLVVVPIVARETFLGILTVSVTHEPARLRCDSELLERLTGVAALAATAIQNGQLVDKLHHKANHDALTGLLNRTGFMQHIERIHECAPAGDADIGLLFMDLDGFKAVNDAYGHDVGDELLRKVALRLEAAARDGDGIARLGGDEFAIVLADIHEADQLQSAEARVRAAFLEPFTVDDLVLSVAVSIGGSVWADDGGSVNELLRAADAAMYADKASSDHTPAEV